MPRRSFHPSFLSGSLLALVLALGPGLGFWLAGAERRTFHSWSLHLPATAPEPSQSQTLGLARLELALNGPSPDWVALAPPLSAWLAQPNLPLPLAARGRHDLAGVEWAQAEQAQNPEDRLHLLTLAQEGYLDLLAYKELEPTLAGYARSRLALVRAQLYELTKLMGDPDYRRLMGLSPDRLAQELEQLQAQWAAAPNPRTGQLKDWVLEILERKLKNYPPFLPPLEPGT